MAPFDFMISLQGPEAWELPKQLPEKANECESWWHWELFIGLPEPWNAWQIYPKNKF